MQIRWGVIAGVLLLVGLAALAWNNNLERPAPAAAPEAGVPEPGAAPRGGTNGSGIEITPPTETDPGMTWSVPKGWMKQIEGNAMRLATYIVPGATPADDGECAVFYFGKGAGGGVDTNLERWVGEFEAHEKQDLKRREVRGIKVAVLEVRGTFAGHTMRTDGAAGPRPAWGLLGAIAEGPQGDVFFKLTGPAKTLDAARRPFDEMIGSLTPAAK